MLSRTTRAWLFALGVSLAGCAGGDPADAASPASAASPAPSGADATTVAGAAQAAPAAAETPAAATPVAVASATGAADTRSATPNPLLTRTVRILCIGDSMTAGHEDDPTRFRSYRGRLFQRLTGAGYQVDFVGTQRMTPAIGGDPDHDGYGGAWIGPGGSSNNMWDRLGGIFGSTDPDIVIVAMGWNSVYNEKPLAGPKYRDLVNRIRSLKPNAHIVVATLSPQRGQTEAQTAASEPGFAALNAAARALAAESATDRIHLADYATAGFNPNDYWDVIHWTQSGADRAADVIYRTLIAGPLRRP